MYIETHSQIDAIQMAGRVRAGLEQLYIVTDAVQNSARRRVRLNTNSPAAQICKPA